ILAVDHVVAEEWGRMTAVRPLSTVDSLLAATAKVHRLTLVHVYSPAGCDVFRAPPGGPSLIALTDSRRAPEIRPCMSTRDYPVLNWTGPVLASESPWSDAAGSAVPRVAHRLW